MSGPLYEKVALLDPAAPAQRILPLSDYPHLGAVLIVPILHLECATLARYWPIAWVAEGKGYDLVAIIGLHPTLGLAARLDGLAGDAIPLAVKAFPLLLGLPGPTGEAKVLIHALPDWVGEGEGEAAFDGSGNLTPAAIEKSDILWLFAAERTRTRAMTEALAAADGLGLWKLRFMFEDQSVENEGYYVVKASFLQDPRYTALAEEHGAPFISMVEHHILARYRVQDLADLLNAVPAPSPAEFV